MTTASPKFSILFPLSSSLIISFISSQMMTTYKLSLLLLLSSFLLLHPTNAEVLSSSSISSSCTGFVSIRQFSTNTQLHKISHTSLNIPVARGVRVVVRQTGNCCHHVFTRAKCKGSKRVVKNNQETWIGENEHTGELSIVRFEEGKRGCERSAMFSKKICKKIVHYESEEAALKLQIQKGGDDDVRIRGSIYNITENGNETVINVKENGNSTEEYQSSDVVVKINVTNEKEEEIVTEIPSNNNSKENATTINDNSTENSITFIKEDFSKERIIFDTTEQVSTVHHMNDFTQNVSNLTDNLTEETATVYLTENNTDKKTSDKPFKEITTMGNIDEEPEKTIQHGVLNDKNDQDNTIIRYRTAYVNATHRKYSRIDRREIIMNSDDIQSNTDNESITHYERQLKSNSDEGKENRNSRSNQMPISNSLLNILTLIIFVI